MNYKQIIHEFDQKVNIYIEELESKLDDINFDFTKSKCFTLNEDFDSKKIFDDPNKKGIYFFEINLENLYPKVVKKKTKVADFIKDWAKKKNDSFFSSSVVKKRSNLYKDFDEEWLPLYIGKSKKINSRIIEHIDLSPNKNTYAMKLRHRSSLIGATYRVSVIELDVINYDFIAPHIERTLREKYKPIVGKQ
ncbi:hypothetical protein [Empedobacter brevis]|uniref:hypothetical protein n=1 Tax=Empedobacter brevis TaxID=247 RepID=UPI002FE2941E